MVYKMLCIRGGHGFGTAGFGSGTELKINGSGYGLEPNGFGSGSSTVPKSMVPTGSPIDFSTISDQFWPVSEGTKTIGSDWSWSRQFMVPKLVESEPNRFGSVPTDSGFDSHLFITDDSGFENRILATPTIHNGFA
ncbi:hypothetical protein JCGZ_10294 [Jatropha curcas]|uniref:Uncharacterized protein n=1 Tax=Jatropha curcas TaxID=180498 RepID=A0A067KMM3_JATCU|nr:hypothetical protein JCGZ_10294 [Jatropha curcas]